MAAPKLQPLPQRETETQFSEQPLERGIVDIAELFSREALKILEEAGKLAASSRSTEVTPFHFLSVLLRHKKIIKLIKDNELAEISNKVQQELLHPSSTPYSGKVFFSLSLKKILFGAYFQAKQDGDSEVDVTHLFRAMSVFPEMAALFSHVSFESSSHPSTSFFLPSTLGRFATDLTASVSLPDFIFSGREKELEQILRVLAREKKHHVLLIGESGVGKSVMGKGLAKLLADKKLPSFSGSRVLTLDLGGLLASPSTLSSFAPKIIEEAGTISKPIFFLEQATLLSNSQQFSLLIHFLQDLEKQGQSLFILPVTPAFYNQFLSAQPYFSSFFEIVKISEFTSEMTEKVLATHAEQMEKFHKVTVNKNIFSETALLAKRYLSGSLPQKALSLLEETCASVSLSGGKTVGIEDIRNVVAQKTGIPLTALTVSEKEKLVHLEKVLGQFVIGQKEAIQSVSEALRRARSGLRDPKKPIGSFLFLGPTGVGKTELAKTLARVFFDDEKAFTRFDMSEFSESHTTQRLIGSPPGYVGYEKGGELTNHVTERPYSLILLDEIEKAHPLVFDLFLQVLDDGRLTDAQGKTVDFNNALIIFTSNLASETIFSHSEELVQPSFDRKKFFEAEVMPLIRRYFRPEFINRFDDIVLFNPLTKEELVQIARLKIKQLADRLAEKHFRLEISDQKLSELVESSYNPSFGARPLQRAIQEQIENPIANKIISGELKEGETIKW